MSHFLDRLNFFAQPRETSADGHSVVTGEDRTWEDAYRNRWAHDKIVRSTHGVNCTGSCSWKIYVKGGIVTWETQQTDYPRTRSDMPNHEPRGCSRGASYSWYLYSANRVKYPLVRGRLLKLWRAARQTLAPVEAWASIVSSDINAGGDVDVLAQDNSGILAMLFSVAVSVAASSSAAVGVSVAGTEATNLIGGVTLARRITSAVHSLFIGTARIGQGDFTHRIPIGSGDQLGDLAGSFNNMSASIEHLRQVEREKLRLDEELQIARRIQQSLLPAALPVIPGLSVADLCEPAMEVEIGRAHV